MKIEECFKKQYDLDIFNNGNSSNYKNENNQLYLAEYYEKFRKSIVIVIGCGGLGSFTSEFLVRAGIGNIILVDYDKIEKSNLSRQVLYDEKDIHKYKATVLKTKLLKGFNHSKITTINKKINKNNIEKILLNAINKINLISKDNINETIICDCVDNLNSTLVINKLAEKYKIPLVHASVYSHIGRVISILFNKDNSLTLETIYKEKKDKNKDSSVLNTNVAIVSAIQANYVFKIITNTLTESELTIIDSWNNYIDVIKLKK